MAVNCFVKIFNGVLNKKGMISGLKLVIAGLGRVGQWLMPFLLSPVVSTLK